MERAAERIEAALAPSPAGVPAKPDGTTGHNRVLVWAAALTTTGEVALEIQQPGLRVIAWLVPEQAEELIAELGKRLGQARMLAAGEIPPPDEPDGGGL